MNTRNVIYLHNALKFIVNLQCCITEPNLRRTVRNEIITIGVMSEFELRIDDVVDF